MAAASAPGRDASILSPLSQAFGADDHQQPLTVLLLHGRSGLRTPSRRRVEGAAPAAPQWRTRWLATMVSRRWVAAISDIHANMPALESVLEAIEWSNVDAV